METTEKERRENERRIMAVLLMNDRPDVAFERLVNALNTYAPELTETILNALVVPLRSEIDQVAQEAVHRLNMLGVTELVYTMKDGSKGTVTPVVMVDDAEKPKEIMPDPKPVVVPNES